MTATLVGSTGSITGRQQSDLLAAVRTAVENVPPVVVVAERAFYHSEAVVLGVEDDPGLDTIQAAVQEIVPGRPDEGSWAPHVTAAYSTARQPMAPIVAAVGRRIPATAIPVR